MSGEDRILVHISFQRWRLLVAKAALHLVVAFWFIRGWPGDVEALGQRLGRFVVAGIKVDGRPVA